MKPFEKLHARWALLLLAVPLCCVATFIPENQKRVETVTYHVSPQGNDTGDGSSSHPFKSLERAQRAVRSANASSNVVVQLADGIYRLESPLYFRALDGGRRTQRLYGKRRRMLRLSSPVQCRSPVGNRTISRSKSMWPTFPSVQTRVRCGSTITWQNWRRLKFLALQLSSAARAW